MNIDEIIFFQQSLYNDFLKQDLNFLKKLYVKKIKKLFLLILLKIIYVL